MRRPPLKCKELVLYPLLFLFYLLSPSYRINCALPGNRFTVCNVCLVQSDFTLIGIGDLKQKK